MAHLALTAPGATPTAGFPAAVGLPVFVTGFESPWKEPDYGAFRRVQDSRPHP